MFYDRMEAGRKLAEQLRKYENAECVVYAIPRGGVVLGTEIAKILHCPLDLIIVRKVGHPYNPEYALCAVTETGERCNEQEVPDIDKQWLAEEKHKERQEAVRRRKMYLEGKESPLVTGKTAILVDDGIATGMTFLMAVDELRKKKPAKIVAALPVMPSEFLGKLQEVVDEVVCLKVDENYLGAVGEYYESFPQVTDEEVIGEMRRNS